MRDAVFLVIKKQMQDAVFFIQKSKFLEDARKNNNKRKKLVTQKLKIKTKRKRINKTKAEIFFMVYGGEFCGCCC